MKGYLWIYLILLSILFGITSCKEEPVVYSEWNNITLINDYGYNLSDVLNAEVQILTSDGGNYNIECVFARTADSTYILSEPIKLPTQSKAIYFNANINSNGWHLYAATNRYGYFDYSPENDVVMVISSGHIRIPYFTVDSIDYTSARYKFKLEDLGTDTVIDFLVRLKNNDNIVYDSVFEANIGIYSSHIDGLVDGTYYTLSLYAHNINGYKLIKQESFNTLALPVPLTIITDEVVNITKNSATFSGEVMYSVDTINVVERGFAWDIYPEPDCLNDSYYICGSGAGSMTKNVYSLDAATKYYVRAFVKTDNSRYYYGNEVSFTTNSYSPAAVADVTILAIGSTYASVSSYIISTGGLEITDRGFVYSLTNNPSFQDYFGMASNGPGDESFYKNISGLWPNTKYYIRAYAVTDAGVYWGNVTSFRTDY